MNRMQTEWRGCLALFYVKHIVLPFWFVLALFFTTNLADEFEWREYG